MEFLYCPHCHTTLPCHPVSPLLLSPLPTLLYNTPHQADQPVDKASLSHLISSSYQSLLLKESPTMRKAEYLLLVLSAQPGVDTLNLIFSSQVLPHHWQGWRQNQFNTLYISLGVHWWDTEIYLSRGPGWCPVWNGSCSRRMLLVFFFCVI